MSASSSVQGLRLEAGSGRRRRSRFPFDLTEALEEVDDVLVKMDSVLPRPRVGDTVTEIPYGEEESKKI